MPTYQNLSFRNFRMIRYCKSIRQLILSIDEVEIKYQNWLLLLLLLLYRHLLTEIFIPALVRYCHTI